MGTYIKFLGIFIISQIALANIWLAVVRTASWAIRTAT